MMSILRVHVLVMAAYGILMLVMAGLPLVNFGEKIIGVGGDPWQTMWRFEEKSGLLSQVGAIEEEFFGGGEPRLVNLSVWPWMWTQWLFGQPQAYNIVWLISFWMSGYSMFLLLKFLLKNTKSNAKNQAAFMAGLYFMFLPFHVAHSWGHFGAMQLQWMPLAILLTLKFLKKPNIYNSLGLSLVVIIQAWSEHHYALWYLLFVGLWLIYKWRETKELWSPVRRPYVVLVGCLWLMFVVLPYWPTIRLARVAATAIEVPAQQTERFSTDLLAFVTPAMFHPIWGEGANMLMSRYFKGNITESTQYLGITVLLLLIFFGYSVSKKERKIWGLIAVIFGIISLGPRLHVYGQAWPLPLPYSLLDGLPVFSAVRTVTRANIMVGVAMSVLLGYVIATQKNRRWINVMVGLVIMVEFAFWPIPRQAGAVSSLYEQIRNLPGTSLIELPAATNYTVSSEALYASRLHSKKIIGNIALERGEIADDLLQARSWPALRQLLFLKTSTIRQDEPEFFNQCLGETMADVLRALEVGGVLVHEDSLSILQKATVDRLLKEKLGLEPIRQDDLSLYPIEERELPAGDGVFISRDGRWKTVGIDQDNQQIATYEGEAGLIVHNNNTENKWVTLSFEIDKPQDNFGIVIEGQEVKYADEGMVIELPAKSAVAVGFQSRTGVTIKLSKMKILVNGKESTIKCEY